MKGLKGEHLSVQRSQPSFLRPQSPTAGYTRKRELVSERRTVRKEHIHRSRAFYGRAPRKPRTVLSAWNHFRVRVTRLSLIKSNCNPPPPPQLRTPPSLHPVFRLTQQSRVRQLRAAAAVAASPGPKHLGTAEQTLENHHILPGLLPPHPYLFS